MIVQIEYKNGVNKNLTEKDKKAECLYNLKWALGSVIDYSPRLLSEEDIREAFRQAMSDVFGQ